MPGIRKKKKELRLSETLLEQIKKEAKARFCRARGSHDWDHTERVYELCLRIGRKEKADLEVLKLAAVLHDIGRAFLFAGEIGARLHSPKIDLQKTKPYTEDDTAYREFLVKLSQVAGRIFTKEGRRIARAGFFSCVPAGGEINRILGRLSFCRRGRAVSSRNNQENVRHACT